VIVAILLYLFGERNIIDNFSLAMSTLATGGFLPNSTILQQLVWQEHLILMAAMILGALPFTFHYAFVRKKFMSPKLGKEVLVYFGVLGVAIVFFTWSSGLEPLFGAFYSVSASTTAGLQLEPLNTFNETSQTILIVLMFIGGCGFSTAGGIKIYRFFHLKNFKKIIKKGTRKTLTSENKKEIVTTIIILISFPLISTITAFHLMEISGAEFTDAFLDASGVITTGGLSANVITIDTDPATKISLSFLMIIGRLEIIAIVYIFVPRLI
jgi:trk system potassium uptake protein TrkH